MRVTTYAQVIATLGEPDSETARTGGYRSIRYGVTPAHERLLTYLPFVQFFVQRCKGCSTAVVLTFNPAEVRGSPSRCRGMVSRLHSLRLRRSRDSNLRLAREACPPLGKLTYDRSGAERTSRTSALRPVVPGPDDPDRTVAPSAQRAAPFTGEGSRPVAAAASLLSCLAWWGDVEDVQENAGAGGDLALPV